MSNKMYFRISRLPDTSLNKYASLSDTGVDGILERHALFLRQWHRIASLGRISLNYSCTSGTASANGCA